MDGSLAFRRSCAHGVCGSDAMVINGREALACKTLIQDVAEDDGATIKIEPARHMEVQRDLMVEQDQFFGTYRAVKPFFIADEAKPAPEKEYPQSDRRARRLRRSDEVHPLRRLLLRVPGHRQEPELHRPGGDRTGLALRLRQPRPGRGGTPRHPRPARRRLGVREPLRVHPGLPARYQGHEDDQLHQARDQKAARGARRTGKRRRSAT